MNTKQLLGRTVMYLTERNRRQIARVLIPAKDSDYVVVRPEGHDHVRVIHASDVIEIIPQN